MYASSWNLLPNDRRIWTSSDQYGIMTPCSHTLSLDFLPITPCSHTLSLDFLRSRERFK
uniref:Uncharacterized protein n=1 Tax=Musa acuminata subsp. malaccensis TaxID=214687 RepID=A0A804U5U2_MUSAM